MCQTMIIEDKSEFESKSADKKLTDFYYEFYRCFKITLFFAISNFKDKVAND